MSETQLLNPRKRQLPEDCTSHQNRISHHLSKKRKHTNSCESRFPPEFWDNLSRVDLTKRALEELDRRNVETAGRAFVGSNQGCQTTQPAVSNPLLCGKEDSKGLKQFARHGGADLSDLRGFSKPSDLSKQAMNSSRSSSQVPKRRSTSNTTKTRSTGPYNRNFQQNLIDGGVYPDGYEYPDGRIPPQPANWEEINQRLSQPRTSLSPSKFADEEFRKFRRADAHAAKEKQVTTSVIPIIEGDIGDAKCVSGGIPFTNLDHLTDGSLVPGNPDIYYGARPEQLDRQVRDKLSDRIIPSTQDDLPIAPNFFLAAKGPDGSAAVAKRQASYDGALGARGIHSLQSYGLTESVFDNNARTISSTYYDGTLKVFTIHPSQPASPEGPPAYHTTQLRSFAMADTIETFRQGATYYRNARDWTKEQRDEVIKGANERASRAQVGMLSADANLEQAFSFASEAILQDSYMPSQESGALLYQSSNITANSQEHDPSSAEFSSEYKPPIKRSGRHLRRSTRRKRRNASESDDDR